MDELFHQAGPDLDEEEARKAKALVRQILQYGPAKRPSSAEILCDPCFCEVETRSGLPKVPVVSSCSQILVLSLCNDSVRSLFNLCCASQQLPDQIKPSPVYHIHVCILIIIVSYLDLSQTIGCAEGEIKIVSLQLRGLTSV